ncbi:MAG: c-type cytochrome [Verrucomicrobia bacterium]|nr:c-type cytochrome [Verrucomicrobiota bacterium]
MLRFLSFITACGLLATLCQAQTPITLPPSPAELAVDHVKLIQALDAAAMERGATLYKTLCIACHGTPKQAGSLPLSRAFWKEPFKNGGDLHGIYRTLTTGLGLMPPWTMLTPQQKYDVAYFVREEYVKPNNPTAYAPVTKAYLAKLPKPQGEFVETAEMKEFQKGPKYLRMDFGPALMWTLEAAPGNIAYKGITVRLDEGAGGVSKGRAWMLYDFDTMRVAAAWSGDKFVDWKGIAFDGSHGTHTKIVGEKAFVNPNAAGWANPATGGYEEVRFIATDKNPYGPLPRDWMRFKGLHQQGDRSILSYSIGTAQVLESPGFELQEGKLIFTRTLEVGPCETVLEMRVADESQTVTSRGQTASQIVKENGFQVLRVPARKTLERVVVSIASNLKAEATLKPIAAPAELSSLPQGGAARWPNILTSQVATAVTGDGLSSDTLAFPENSSNPWQTQWRIGGLDFFADGNRLALCTWMGDVWIVEGILDPAGKLTWKRIGSGLNQPLGLKIVDGIIHITCRDQLVKLRDLNGDGETDFYECFNSDHQVTEHFHEFAMGLQTDAAGNFYYAKSARHAKPPLVPQHGTLLRVSKDGSKTTIVANGFRAANGVSVNDDGTFYVTDQEGHWTPKNRINLVRQGQFYGNMWSYGPPEDNADTAMQQPLVWLTNEFDRSPGELVRVTPSSWNALQNKLIDISYGMGRMNLILQDESDPAQGAAVALPLPDFPTGAMRGRFHPTTGDLYTCGMAVWASNKIQDGGLYRVRRTASALNLPVQWKTAKGSITVTFSDPLDKASAEDLTHYSLKVWDLERSKNYGSKHLKERALPITQAQLAGDQRTVTLSIPDLAPTRGLELQCTLKAADGKGFTRSIHATIHKLK